jgi:hypothetical protein
MTVTLIGGDMPLWSDLDATHGPVPAGGAALRPLLGAVSGRTLVAGPHDPTLLAALPVSDVTVLARGAADASVLDRPGVSVLCGSLEKVPAGASYDTVVALDGLDRLISAEGVDRTWDEILGLLAGLLRPGGRLLLGVENVFGLHRLVALPAQPSDADWVVADEHDPSRPRSGGPFGLRGRLAGAGLGVVAELAAYPLSPADPLSRADRLSQADPLSSADRLSRAEGARVLVGSGFFQNPDFSGFLEARLSAAAAPMKDVLADPRRLAAGAVRNGLVSELAPGWIVLAEKDSAAADSAGAAVLAGAALLAGGAVPAGAASEMLAGAAIWPDAVIVADGQVQEIRLPDSSVPRGRTLEDLLLAACQRRDLPAMRELLAAWLGGTAAGVPADQVVVGADGRHTGLARAVHPLVALREFAAEVIRGGYAHLWPAPTGEAELTALLAGMTGRELEPSDVPPAPERKAAESVRELITDRDRLAKDLAEARAKHEWYENMLRNREAELKRVRQVNKVLKATVPGRAATSLYGGLRAGKKAVRGVVKKAKG